MSNSDKKESQLSSQSASPFEERPPNTFNTDSFTPPGTIEKNMNYYRGLDSITDAKSFYQYLSLNSIDSEREGHSQYNATHMTDGEGLRVGDTSISRNIFSKEIGERERVPEMNNIRFQRLSSMLEMTVMAHAKVPANNDFTIDNWAKFQDMLKSNYLIVNSELHFKEKLLKEIEALVLKYTNLYLRNRENNERIRKRLDKEEFKEEDIVKVLYTDENDGLGDASLFVKKLLFTLYEKPKVITTIIKNNHDHTSLKALEETFCNAYYEDLIAIEAHDHNVLRLLVELLEVEFDRAKKPGDLFRTEHFTNKVLTSYLRRNEYKKYIKLILKIPLLLCVRESRRIRFDPQDIERRIKKEQASKQTPGVPEKPTKNRHRFNTDSDMKEMLGKEEFVKEVMQRSLTALDGFKDQINVPRFNKKDTSRKTSACKSLYQLDFKPPEEIEDAFEMVYEDAKQSAMEKIKNPEVVKILEQNLAVVKKHLSALIQSIFDNLYSMPIGLRVLSKVTLRLARAKFPGLNEKDYNEILGNYIFRRWISPNFVFPEHNGILSDLHLSKEETSNNLMEIVKILQAIFSQSIFPESDVKSELNPYIEEILPSVAEYYRELVAVNNDIEDNILNANVNTPTKTCSRSICISLFEINVLCESIQKYKEEVANISPECLNLAEKVLYLEKENKLFVERTNPATGSPLKTTQIFILFNDLIFPPGYTPDYIMEFDKLCSYSKNASERDKIVPKAKHILKQILLETDDISELKYTAIDGRITLDDVLRNCRNKLSYSDIKNTAKGSKISLDLSAKFLEPLLERLDDSYTFENYKGLHSEMYSDFEKVAQQLDLTMSKTKLQLLKGLEALKKRYAGLENLNEKKRKALKKSFVREFIRMIKIPLCVTSPSTMKTLVTEEQAQQRNLLKKSTTIPDKITLILKNEEGCIHERFALARELASSGLLSGRPHSKSCYNEKALKKEDDKKNDIFNENNYHCETIDQFVNIFGGLYEVKDAIITGDDKYGVAEALTFYYDKINAGAKIGFKNVVEDEYGLILDEIENYITKRLYSSVFPVSETEKDLDFYYRCKLLEWVSFEHLEIAPENRCEEMWLHAAQILNEIDSKTTSVGKLECVVDCFKTITKVMQLASLKDGGIGADDTLPVMIYVLLKASPKRLHSNFNFVSFLRDEGKMLAGEGYCFIQLRSAALTVQAMDAGFLKMSQEKFNSYVHAKQIEHGLTGRKFLSQES